MIMKMKIKMNKRQSIFDAMHRFLRECKSFDMSEPRIRDWHLSLANFSDSEILEASFDIIGTGTSYNPPPLGMLRERILLNRDRGVDRFCPYVAWRNVQKKLNNTDHQFTESEKQAVRDSFGVMFNLRNSKNPAADRASFIAAYKAQAKKDHDEMMRLPREITEQLQLNNGQSKQLEKGKP